MSTDALSSALAAARTILFDVDGTLIDSNAAHAETWAIALREHGYTVGADRIRPLIGMGGDKLLPAVTGLAEDDEAGKAIGARKKALFQSRVASLQATPGARDLVAALRDRGLTLVVATSADEKEMRALLAQAGVDDLFAATASKDDAADSKPDPDIVNAALRRAGAEPARTIMIGDTPYDVEAASRAGVATVALRCGGFWRDDQLRGALWIADDPRALLAAWQHVPGRE